MGKRKTHTATCKAKVVLELLREEQALAHIAGLLSQDCGEVLEQQALVGGMLVDDVQLVGRGEHEVRPGDLGDRRGRGRAQLVYLKGCGS